MKKPTMSWLVPVVLLACSAAVLAQEPAQTAKPQATKPQSAKPHPAKTNPAKPQLGTAALPPFEGSGIESEKKNIQAYIELIRSNVRQQKTEIMGSVMALGASESAKFWPIYSEYDDELTKLNNLRSSNIEEYARSYTEMTDSKADELIKRAMDYQRQRHELLGKYYERVKDAIGGINAARFVQIENQLLMIIDLQISAALPVVGQP